MGADFVQLSLVPIVIGVLAAMACALPGNFLVLRRQALLGDAISHVVFPGIVLSFLVSGLISTWSMVLGALVAAFVAAVMIETIRRYGKIEAGAAMGVTFTALFAIGVLVLEQTDTSSVHLDVEHALYGSLESLIWFDAVGWNSLVDVEALRHLPAEFFRIAITFLGVAALIFVFWRPLSLATFDESYAATRGYPTVPLSFGIILVAAVAAVAAFDAVGSIIVIAMFICPPAAARLMTNRLGHQVGWSLVFATISAVLGYVIAGYGPMWVGAAHALSAAGMIATVSGVILALACVFGPHARA